MKRTVISAALLLATVASTSFAQSNITVYGLYDTALRYSSNADAFGNSKIAITDGAMNGSKLGFTGEEDLGGGSAALFKLETGFGTGTGALGQQGQIFGRVASVGLKNISYGELTMGRQYGLAFNFFADFDPLHQGNSPENSWQVNLEGLRFDNTIEYANQFGPVLFKAQYSVGGSAGSTNVGSTRAFDLAYGLGSPFSVGGVFQQSTDANSAKATVYGLGSSYIVGPATLYLGLLETRRDPGFARGANSTAAAPSNAPLANTSLSGNVGNTLRRDDDLIIAGVKYQATSAVSYILGYMHDSVKNDASNGSSGSLDTVYALAFYALSKRTDVYVQFDHTSLGGGEITSPNNPLGAFGGGRTSRNDVMFGLRTLF